MKRRQSIQWLLAGAIAVATATVAAQQRLLPVMPLAVFSKRGDQ
jgi:hypothetical protein